MIDQHRQAFKEEAYELLAELETSLLELEERPDDIDLIGRVFRAMHTIKGSGSMFGFDDIAAFTHEVETIFDMVRNGKLQVTARLVNLTLAARDQIRAMLDAADEVGEGADLEESGKIISGLRELAGFLPTAAAAPAVATAAKKPENLVTYRIRFVPSRDIFITGTNPLTLLQELKELGTCSVVAQTGAFPCLEEMDPEACYVFWDLILTTNQGENAIRDVFIFVEDDCELKIEQVAEHSQFDEPQDYKKLGMILLERGDITAEEMDEVLAQQRKFGELALSKGILDEGKLQSALVEQRHVKEVRQEKQATEAASSIRVPAERLDLLVNLVGEMVTVQARLSQTAAQRADAELLAIAEEVERLTAELRDSALNIRMLPIGSTFSKFKRLVRDLSVELGKQIDMTTEGAETELDKTVIEKLNDPLVHLIRNSIDHGIELPEARVEAGKPANGTVHLAAVHSGDSVVITIEDDGAGLDKEAIRSKAIEKGIIAATAELSEKELFGLIFAPGFSTAKKISSVSGRGVGMDVVKRAIEALRGSIDISSVRGKGTTIAVKIPLTLAIIESLRVQIGADSFMLPLALVDECVELTREDVARSHGRNLARVRAQMIPYIPLREHFRIQGDPPEIQQIVITQVNGVRVGFVVDQVIGEHQTVIKSLGRAYRDVDGISGATILGDGSVALILDVPQLLQSVEEKQP
ncbi:Signal transduction histidine kinase CheA [Citrifermentans bremense]|uniref:Chemotaxis protein CheA n=1 Tax=Citrifermentans bremense TaxID=60035 RepID=A0A6S6M8H1_9BACT|nr:chemotaxis protein CheA [Citrifermentans bremense]BCG47791.1 Signal transduction histidine kinase CheA [Citrifermentans bremense]